MPERIERPNVGVASACEQIAAALQATADLDAIRLERVLADAAVALGRGALLETVLAPLLSRIGESWRDGKLGIAHEHMATAVVRNTLAAMLRPDDGDRLRPVFVAATPAGQMHELGALLAAVASDALGFRVVYLGANLPVDEIAGAARATGARAVGLSVVYPADDPRLGDELVRLSGLLPKAAGLVVGGAAALAYARWIERAGIAMVADLAALQAWLERLRQAPLESRRARSRG
jgi:methanogenic corrinoid protein MtbC1